MLLPLTKILIRRHNCNLRSLKRDSLISYAKIFHVLLRPKLAKKTSLKISLLRIRDLSFSRHVYTLEKPLRILVFVHFLYTLKSLQNWLQIGKSNWKQYNFLFNAFLQQHHVHTSKLKCSELPGVPTSFRYTLLENHELCPKIQFSVKFKIVNWFFFREKSRIFLKFLKPNIPW